MRSMWPGVLPVCSRLQTSLAQILLSAALLGSLSLSAAASPSVWVFTTKQLPPLKRMELAHQVFVLDDIEKPLNALKFQYPGNDDKAQQHANAILNSQKGQALLAQIKRNARSVAIAWQFGITRLPAVLVDEQYVVYGEYNLHIAVDRVARYRHAR